MVHKFLVFIIMSFSSLAQAIPLDVVEVKPGSFDIQVEVNFDDMPRRFTLDTGANKTSVSRDEQTNKYRSSDKVKSQGLASKRKGTECEMIRPDYISMDNLKINYPEIKRCTYNLLGMDMLGKNVVELDFTSRKLVLHPAVSLREAFLLERFEYGAPKLQVSINDNKLKALFDTGAQRTAVDLSFVKNNSQLFKPTGQKLSGFDSTGAVLNYDVYEVLKFQVGSLVVENLKVLVFDFGPIADHLGKDSPVIIGADVIVRANWILDLGSNKWAVAPGNL